MAKQEKNNAALNKTMSTLLEFQGVSVSKETGRVQLLQPTIEQPTKSDDTSTATSSQAIPQEIMGRKNRSVKKPRRALANRIFIVTAWILLLSNVLAVVGIMNIEQQGNLSLKTLLQVIPGHVFQLLMLAFGSVVLVSLTLICWKNKLGVPISLTVTIVISLAVMLAYLITTPIGKAVDSKGFKIADVAHSNVFSAIALNKENAVVSGIIYVQDNPSAIIGSQVIQEGDALYGVNVLKIHKDKVEFEKNGNRWTQVIHQKPAAFWE